METISRWLCSFYTEKVRFHPNRTTIPNEEVVLLGTIELTSAKSTFTDYHENKLSVSYLNENVAAVASGCRLYLWKGNTRINVYCEARRAGKAIVKLDLGSWYQFEGINIRYRKVIHIFLLALELFSFGDIKPAIIYIRYTLHDTNQGLQLCTHTPLIYHERFRKIF